MLSYYGRNFIYWILDLLLSGIEEKEDTKMYSPIRQHNEEVAAHEELCDKIHEAAEAGATTFNYNITTV